ncbi:MFS transporter [Neobacillus sp. 114]|uniref:MFS transporter n=1 Tax=Neobacillus sp. 114 TaxID=3048535 RepID=UPI0024C31A9C|nr:MFS transporter [Neobacillus sp. 114]
MNDRIIIPLWAIGSFLVLMNTTMFNVALPTIIHELHISAGEGSWIVSGYSIVFALSTVIFSRLSDYVSIRKLLFVGLTLLGAASVMGFFAHSFGILMAARLVQASGAGAVPGLGIVLASRYVPFERRGRAITIIASGSSLAFALGPVIGGVITQFMGWNGLFLITSLVIPLVPVLWRLLPQEIHTEFNFDIPGAALTAIVVVSILISVMQLSIWFLLLSFGALVANIWHLRKVKNPFVPPNLFHHHGYRKLLVVSFCAFILNMSMIFMMPLLLADWFHMSAGTVGLMMCPGSLLAALLIRKVGRWIDQYGNYRFLIIGHFFLAASMILMTLLVQVSPYIVMIGYIIFAPALSTVLSALSNEVSRILAKDQIGSGMGLSQLSQFFGGSLAVAVCGVLISWQTNKPLITGFQNIYLLLIVVLLGSISILIWYGKRAHKGEINIQV